MSESNPGAGMNFHGHVSGGQFAGQDIINEAVHTLWDDTTEELEEEIARCRKRHWKLQREFFVNFPSIFLLCAICGTLWLLFSGIYFRAKTPGLYVFGAMTLIFGASARLAWIRRGKKKMIHFYQERIELIDLILRDRGVR